MSKRNVLNFCLVLLVPVVIVMIGLSWGHHSLRLGFSQTEADGMARIGGYVGAALSLPVCVYFFGTSRPSHE